METALIVLGILVLLLLLISSFLIVIGRVAIWPKWHTLEADLERIKEMPMMQKEPIVLENEHTVVSYDGYELYTALVPGDPKNKHYVILSHGYTSTQYWVYRYAVLYRKMGYNCILYTDRGHGNNKKTYCSFGHREARDLMAIIEDTYKRYGADIRLGLHGESMGSGLQINALQYGPKVDFIVNDCGYGNIYDVLCWKCKLEFRLPGCVVAGASFFTKLLYGFSFREVKPIQYLSDNEIPICFVHGDADDFVLPWHSRKMYEANKGYCELHMFEGAEHAMAVDSNPERYMEMLRNFLAKVYPEETV